MLIHTDRTREIAARLRALLEPWSACHLCEVDPYHVLHIYDRLARFIAEELPAEPLTFNLTGGTKPMILAALEVDFPLRQSGRHRRGQDQGG